MKADRTGLSLSPREIEERSFGIIRSELRRPLPEETADIVLRVIHATADFSFAENLYFSPDVVRQARALLLSGATVVTDTNMALAGISKGALQRTGSRALCFMADPEVAAEARLLGSTRAGISARRAAAIPGPKVLCCGNAPTFLLSLLEQAPPEDTVVIGVPVGFVNVVEAKEALIASGLPCIVARGRRGGSGVAAAIVNALLYGLEGVRP